MLFDQYRPSSWASFAGHARQVAAVQRALKTFDAGAFWIDGPSGVGKTSMAQVIATELGTAPFAITELDGERCTVDAVRQLADTINQHSLFSDWQAWIINEAHSMTAKAVQAWLTLLERLPYHRLIAFTTTETSAVDLFGQFTQPLLSRCLHVTLTTQGLAKAYAPVAKAIAEAEGIDGAPVDVYERLIELKRGNLRAVLSAVEMGQV